MFSRGFKRDIIFFATFCLILNRNNHIHFTCLLKMTMQIASSLSYYLINYADLQLTYYVNRLAYILIQF